jgi:hypothetical protein
MSLDGFIKLFSEEGELEKEIETQGALLNGCVIPNRTDYFVVSLSVEETEQNFVQIYRRFTEKKSIGPLDNQVLDLKMSSLGNMLFLPKSLFSLDRLELKDI